MTFTSYEHVSDIAAEVDEGKKHVPKENMVIAVSSNCKNSKGQVIVALATRSKKEVKHQGKIIKTISSEFKEKNGAPLLNWLTDDDPARRQFFSSLMLHEISDPMLKSIISDLKLFDMKVGENNETTNFNPKHLAKRMRNFLIGNSVKIGEKLMQPSDISKVLSASKSFDSKHKVQRLLNPDDKQNVD